MSIEISQKIDTILSDRKKQLPEIEAELRKWTEIQERTRQLIPVLQRLQQIEGPEAAIAGAAIERCRNVINTTDSIHDQLTQVRARFMRDTINIGVSGVARMGKSTLLQSISGLDEDQIPTGSGIPVTAVRSRIFHDADQPRAVLTFHNWASFASDRLKPFHEALQLGKVPTSVEAYSKFEYPASHEALPPKVRDRQSSESNLKRLRDMQKALPFYKDLLTGLEQTVSLDGLRSYVAYPTNDEENKGNPARKYLAVKDAEIFSPFPAVQVSRVGIVDLPGLGEAVPNAEKPHMEGLRNNVDTVLLVKRAVEGFAFWKDEDTRAMDILDEARGAVEERKDFVSIVINTADPTDTLTKNLRDEIRRTVNMNADGSRIHVRECDAKDPDSVTRDLLRPVLEQLAKRLPEMDQQVVRAATILSQDTIRALNEILNDIGELGQLSAPGRDEREAVLLKSKRLQAALAYTLSTNIIRDRRTAARSANQGNPEFENRVLQIRNTIEAWLQKTYQDPTWIKNTKHDFAEDQSINKVVLRESHAIRIHISESFQMLDEDYHEKEVEKLHREIVEGLREETGLLLPASPPENRAALTLSIFEEQCTKADSPQLARATAVLRKLNIEYKSHLHPRVREKLDILNVQDILKTFTVSYDEPQAVEQTSELLIGLGQKAAYAIEQALITGESQLCAQVLYTAAEQFEDALIRAKTSEIEFRRLGETYRHLLWPEEFQRHQEMGEIATELQLHSTALRTAL